MPVSQSRSGTSRHRPKAGSHSIWKRLVTGVVTGARRNGQRLGWRQWSRLSTAEIRVGLKNVTIGFLRFASIPRSRPPSPYFESGTVSRNLVGGNLQEQFAQAQAALRAIIASREQPIQAAAARTALSPGGGPHTGAYLQLIEAQHKLGCRQRWMIDCALERWRAFLQLAVCNVRSSAFSSTAQYSKCYLTCAESQQL